MTVLARRSQKHGPVLGIVKASITLGHVVIYSWCVRGAVRKQQVSLSRSLLGTQVLLHAASALTPFFHFYTVYGDRSSLFYPYYTLSSPESPFVEDNEICLRDKINITFTKDS